MFERNNGYIDLDSYFLEKYNCMNVYKLEKMGVVEIINDVNFWFSIGNQRYMFKMCSSKDEEIKELLASEMLETVGYDHATYDLALFNGMYGVITKDFKKDYCNYYSGDDLIENYHRYLDEEPTDKIDYAKYNNLESIWDLLEIKYRNNPNKKNIIKNILYKLSEKYLFDILINQCDGASYNWLVEETEDYATLAPIFDNQKMLNGLHTNSEKNLNIRTDVFNENEEYSNISELQKFLNYSSSYFQDEFERLMNYLNPLEVKRMFINLEYKLNFKIDNKIKDSIYSQYVFNYNMLQNELNNFKPLKR